jgi:thiosulfate/3-mercaptopyruvate sulfurtransferase
MALRPGASGQADLVKSNKPMIDASVLLDCLDVVAVVHVGTRMGGADPQDDFERRHLPGARFIVLDDALAAAAGPVVGRHPMPSAESFAAALGVAGIEHGQPVVAYDDRNGAWAARLVWMLRILDQPATLLDGGLESWQGATETGPAEDQSTDWPILTWPAEAMATADDVVAHLATGGAVIDSRAPERYRGDLEPIDNVAGHVPGAMNLPFTDNLVDGRFRPLLEQRDRFAGLAHDRPAIVYCGSGVTACHNALAIEAVGLPRPRVYVGSWSGWSTDPRRPIATGPEPI